MDKYVGLGAFVLLVIGTLGLLLNEIAFDWGRNATLTFALANVIGLAILAYGYWRKKRDL